MNISAVIIAKNEADRISATIASVIDVVAEVIVLDTGSSDDTITVAELAGARVISQKWQGYGPTKNMGAQYAHYDWILSLDADEVLSQELSVSLENIKPQRGNTYSVNRLVNYKSQWITGCGWHPDWVHRLYHRQDCSWDESLVHENLKLGDTKSCKLDGVLYHYSFRDEAHFKNKIEEYAKLSAQQWIKEGKSPSLAKRYFGYLWKYIQTYYIYQGYKNGSVGKEIATVLADGVRKKVYYYDRFKKDTEIN